MSSPIDRMIDCNAGKKSMTLRIQITMKIGERRINYEI